MPDALTSARLSVQQIRHRLDTTAVGHHLYLFDGVESTNATLRAIARAGGAEGTVVIADSQTEARGRHGQVWFSPAGVNLHASVLFRPAFHPREAAWFSITSSLAVSDAVQDLGGHAAIKWPNDVLLGGKKIAGTLTECAMWGGDIDFLIVGAGVNLNVSPQALREALGSAGLAATSVAQALGREVDRNAFVASYLTHLDRWVMRYRAEGPHAVIAAWRDRDILTDRRVEVRGSGGSFEGRVLGVDVDGHLLVRGPGGRRHTLASEEVRALD